MAHQTQRNISDDIYLFFDVDGTWIEEDTGLELFILEDMAEDAEHYREMMSETYGETKTNYDEPREGKGNELALTLEGLSERKIDSLEETASFLDGDVRNGPKSLLEDVREDVDAVAHSAGWRPAVEAVTNGYFDEKMYAETAQELKLNGRKQKAQRMQEYLISEGVEDPVEDEAEAHYMGDSNTDIEAIRYADATGGLGIAIGDSLKDAKDVEEATLYVADPKGDHDLSAALLYHHLNGRNSEETSRFIDEYNLDISSGEADVGELAEYHGREEYVGKLIKDVKGLEGE